MKVNLLVAVTEGNAGDKKIREVRVDQAGMEIILFLPVSGIIVGLAEKSQIEKIKKVDGVDTVMTELEFKEILSGCLKPA